MLISEIVGKDWDSLSEEEMDYLLNTDVNNVYILKKDNKFLTFCVYMDGSITQRDAETDEEIASSMEEMELLKKDGYSVKDITEEYVF